MLIIDSFKISLNLFSQVAN